MKHLALVLCLALLAPCAWAQPEAEVEDTITQRDAAERERIQQARASEQARLAAQEARCYAQFAANDCLIAARATRREVFADLRRQEISLNDAQRKRRGADQLLRSDEKLRGAP